MKGGVRNITCFLVFSNLFISSCAAILTTETFIIFNYQPVCWFIAIVFSSTQIIYSLHYLAKSKTKKIDQRLIWTRNNKQLLAAITFFSIASTLALIITHLPVFGFSRPNLNFSKLVLALFIPIFSLSYSHQVFPGIKKGIRYRGWLKPIYLSFIWSFTTVVLPLFFVTPNSPDDPKVLVLLAQRFVFILSLCFLFNINDVEEDKSDGLRTFAVVHGPETSLKYGKWLMFIANTISSSLLIVYFKWYQPALILCIFVPVFLLLWLYKHFKISANDAMFVIRYDGMMVLKAALLIFALTL